MANTFKFGNKNWAVKEDYVLAYNDENSNFKPLPFDFTRSSTATYVDSDGLIKTAKAGHARIDYLDNADGHLLLEPSRRNIVLDSNSPSSGGSRTTKSGTTIKFVDGITDVQSDKSVSSGTPYLYYNNITFASGTSYTFSVFVRKTDSNPLNVNHVKLSSHTNLFPANDTIFSLNSGTIVSTEHDNATITAFNDGWYRITVTEVSSSSGQGFNFLVYPAVDSSGTVASITAVGQELLYTNGFQIEDGGSGVDATYATSYIPTEGSSVTRAADSCEGAGNSEVFNDSEGVLYAEIEALGVDTSYRQITIGNLTDNIKILFNASSTRLRGLFKVGGVNQADLFDETQTEIKYFKIALKYKSSDFALWVNGVEKDTATSGSIPTGMSDIAFDDGGGASDFYGKIKDIKVYNTALSDSELETLTT